MISVKQKKFVVKQWLKQQMNSNLQRFVPLSVEKGQSDLNFFVACVSSQSTIQQKYVLCEEKQARVIRACWKRE